MERQLLIKRKLNKWGERQLSTSRVKGLRINFYNTDFSSDYPPPPTHTLIMKTPKIDLTKNSNFI